MKNANVEFVTFDAQDVIATSEAPIPAIVPSLWINKDTIAFIEGTNGRDAMDEEQANGVSYGNFNETAGYDWYKITGYNLTNYTAENGSDVSKYDYYNIKVTGGTPGEGATKIEGNLATNGILKWLTDSTFGFNQ